MFADGNIIFNVYAADGRKLSSYYATIVTKTVNPIENTILKPKETISGQIGTPQAISILDYDILEAEGTHYVDNFEYLFDIQDESEEMTAMRIHNSEGYVENGDWYYFRRDHLGNNREVWNATQGEIVQVTNYYPSGLPWTYETEQVQPYLYNGKEFVEMGGFDTYDYGFRGYYPAIVRFTSIDPLAEAKYSGSPYIYAANNPVKNIDWLGLSASTTTDPDEIAALLSHLGSGGSVNDYDFSCWEDTSWFWDLVAENPYDYVWGGGSVRIARSAVGSGSGMKGGMGGGYNGIDYEKNSQPYTKSAGDKLNITDKDLERLRKGWIYEQKGKMTCVFAAMSLANNTFYDKRRKEGYYLNKYKGKYPVSDWLGTSGSFLGVIKENMSDFLGDYFSLCSDNVCDAIDAGALIFVRLVYGNGKEHGILIVGYTGETGDLIYFDPKYGTLFTTPRETFAGYDMWNVTGK